MEKKFKIGEKVVINTGTCGHSDNQIGTVIGYNSDFYVVIVDGIISTSNYSPAVAYLDGNLRKIDDYRTGDYVILKNVRPDNWNLSGEMDMYLGALVKIRDITGTRVSFKNANSRWSFRVDNIERLATLKEISNYNSYLIGEIVVIDNLAGGYNGNIGEVCRIGGIDESKQYLCRDKNGMPVRGAYFSEKHLRFANAWEIENSNKPKSNPVTIAGEKLNYNKKKDIYTAGCKTVYGAFVRQLIEIGKDLPIDSINIRGEKLTLDELIKRVDAVTK